MDWWYIIGGIFLGWSIPWAILQISDGMFLLNQIFRITYWGGIAIAYEVAGINWVYCLLLAYIPGVLIWNCYDYWFDDGDDEPQKIGDEFKLGTSIEQLPNSESLIVMPSSPVQSE